MADDPLVVNNQPGQGAGGSNVSRIIKAHLENDATVAVGFNTSTTVKGTRTTKTHLSTSSTPPPQTGSSSSTASEMTASNTAVPQTIDKADQQNIAGSLESDRQKKPDEAEQPNRVEPNQAVATDDSPSENMKVPNEEATADNLMKGDLGKGEIGEGPSTPRATLPQLSPDEQNNAAANNSSQTQADQQQQQMTQLQQQEAQISQSIQGMKGTILSGKWIWLLRKIPLVSTIVTKLESTAKKGVKHLIRALEKIKSLAKTTQTTVAIAEAWVKYFQLLGALCTTGIGILVAIIIAVPGLLIVTIMAVISPQAVSKTARLIDTFIKELNTILKPLKKFYTTTEQKKASLLKVRQLMVGVQNTRVEPPPGPS